MAGCKKAMRDERVAPERGLAPPLHSRNAAHETHLSRYARDRNAHRVARPGCRAACLKGPPILGRSTGERASGNGMDHACHSEHRSEEHTSELQSRSDLVCRLLLEKKKKTIQ